MFKVSQLIRKLLLTGIAAIGFMSPYQTVAYGWGDKGHRIVAILADHHLTAQAREKVGKLLPADTTLADAAVWPDKEGPNNRIRSIASRQHSRRRRRLRSRAGLRSKKLHG